MSATSHQHVGLRRGVALLLVAIALPTFAQSIVYLNTVPGSGAFGTQVIGLPNGNIVVSDPRYSSDFTQRGAVHLYRPDGLRIATLAGDGANDEVGTEVVVLANGWYVVVSPGWDDESIPDVGAVTLCNPTTGCNGVVTRDNSLTGAVAFDAIGSSGAFALSNGHFVVASPYWDDGATEDVGAVTWVHGTLGLVGTVSVANSLVGGSPFDQVGYGLLHDVYVDGFSRTLARGIVPLPNGNYVVASMRWDNAAATDAGAATWAPGDRPTMGVVSQANSIVGTHAYDDVGGFGPSRVVAMGGSNFIVQSPAWDNGSISNAGAVTWVDGAEGGAGAIDASNSLVGTTTDETVGGGGILLPDGDFLEIVPNWDNGAVAQAGAVARIPAATGVTGPLSAANALVGSSAGDASSLEVTLSTNGNYLVRWPSWDGPGASSAGAVTFVRSGESSVGAVGPVNSLVGGGAAHEAGRRALALDNGDFVVSSAPSPGRLTRIDGGAGATGTIAPASSLVGSASNPIGSTLVALRGSGRFVLVNPSWNESRGHVVLLDGSEPLTGTLDAHPALTGTTSGDRIGSGGIAALSNGHFVVSSPDWNAFAGAVTWVDGTTAPIGTVTSANSLVGLSSDDRVGVGGVFALSGGDFVVMSPQWSDGTTLSATTGEAARYGAVTKLDGTTAFVGSITAQNSMFGIRLGDQAGGGASCFGFFPCTRGFTAFSDGNFAIYSPAVDGEPGLFDPSERDVGTVTLARPSRPLRGSTRDVSPTWRGVNENDGYGVRLTYDAAYERLFVRSPQNGSVVALQLQRVLFQDGFEP